MSLAVIRFATQIRSLDKKNGDVHAQALTQLSRDNDQQAALTAPLVGGSGFSADETGTLSVNKLNIRNPTSRFEFEDPAPIQSIASAGQQIIPLGRWQRLLNTSGGSLVLTGTPTIATSGAQNGQYLALVNIGANPMTFQDSGTLANSGLQLLSSTVVLAQGQTLELRYLSDSGIAKWSEIAAVSTTAAAFAECSAYRSTTQAIPNNAFTSIAFDTELYDVDAMHSTVTNPSRFTVPSGQAGTYLVTACATFVASAAGTIRTAQLLLNGATILSTAGAVAGTAANATVMQIHTQQQLSVNDYIELQVFQDSGGNLNASSGRNFTFLQIARLN